MNINIAQESGFCFGVRRAIRLLKEAAEIHGNLETIGAAVHNHQVVESLSQLGISAVESLDSVQCSTVAIPAHGLDRRVIEKIKKRHIRIVDATCPKVRKAQLSAEQLAKDGFWVIVFGDTYHPEVQGVLGWAGGNGIATLDSEIILNIGNLPNRAGILSQTTRNPAQFANFVNEITASVLSHVVELRIVNTICNATKRRQDAALELARKVDMMLVIGGHHSANTNNLAELCAATGVETHHIETVSEMRQEWLGNKHIGLTAGASTPDEVTKEVIAYLKENG